MPREGIAPRETLESYLGQADTKPLINYILRNHRPENTNYPIQRLVNQTSNVHYASPSDKSSESPQEAEKMQQKIEHLKKFSIRDATLQEEIHRLLNYTTPERKREMESLSRRAHFPLPFTPNLNSKSKWQVRWHQKVAPLVKYAYQIFHGSINPANPFFHPKLREILRLSERCLVCRLTNKEWRHPEGILIAGNLTGRCSAKVADPLVPQSATWTASRAEALYGGVDSIRFLCQLPQATLPRKATTGSAAYNVYPAEEVTVPPHS